MTTLGPRFRRVAAELRERITLGDYGPQGELESESELCARYAVSRVTVRRALELLRNEGLVASRRGAGWQVIAGAIGQTLALGSFHHASSAIHASGLSVRRRVTEFRFDCAPREVAGLLELPLDAEVLRCNSVRYAGDEPIDAVTEWVPASIASPIARDAAEQPGIWATLRQLGHVIHTVQQSIAAVAATGQASQLLAVEPGTPLLLVRRRARAADGRPLALSDHRYLGHRFRLDVEFRGWPAADVDQPPGLTSNEEDQA